MRPTLDPQPLLISSSPRFEPRALSLSERDPWEKMAILEFHRDHPFVACRRLAFMVEWEMVWVDGRATWRRRPSTAPGAKTEGAARHRPVFCFGIDTKAVNQTIGASVQLLVYRTRFLHFTVNYYTVDRTRAIQEGHETLRKNLLALRVMFARMLKVHL